MDTSTRVFLDFLRGNGINAYTENPRGKSEFVTIERVGGERGQFVDNPSFAVQAWAETKQQAEFMASEAASAIASLSNCTPRIASATVSSIYNYPDPDSSLERFQLTANIAVRV